MEGDFTRAYLKRSKVDGAAASLINEIKSTQFSLVLAPARGGLPLGVVASNVLNVPLVPIDVQTRDSEKELTLRNFRIIDRIPDSKARIFRKQYKDKPLRILITEDIIDTGKTIELILSGLELLDLGNLEVYIISYVGDKSLNKFFYARFPFVKKITSRWNLTPNTWYVFPWETIEGD